mmetsp:Transcript_102496/g.289483  ORF Transcript_102496/g.289483 Transcript_102496/m.289483 type:complete len:390 (+) Transcript_102496:752-1921(+)
MFRRGVVRRRRRGNCIGLWPRLRRGTRRNLLGRGVGGHALPRIHLDGAAIRSTIGDDALPGALPLHFFAFWTCIADGRFLVAGIGGRTLLRRPCRIGALGNCGRSVARRQGFSRLYWRRRGVARTKRWRGCRRRRRCGVAGRQRPKQGFRPHTSAVAPFRRDEASTIAGDERMEAALLRVRHSGARPERPKHLLHSRGLRRCRCRCLFGLALRKLALEQRKVVCDRGGRQQEVCGQFLLVQEVVSVVSVGVDAHVAIRVLVLLGAIVRFNVAPKLQQQILELTLQGIVVNRRRARQGRLEDRLCVAAHSFRAKRRHSQERVQGTVDVGAHLWVGVFDELDKDPNAAKFAATPAAGVAQREVHQQGRRELGREVRHVWDARRPQDVATRR